MLWSVALGGAPHCQRRREPERAGRGVAETEEEEEEVVMVERADGQKFTRSRQAGHPRWSAQPAARQEREKQQECWFWRGHVQSKEILLISSPSSLASPPLCFQARRFPAV